MKEINDFLKIQNWTLFVRSWAAAGSMSLPKTAALHFMVEIVNEKTPFLGGFFIAAKSYTPTSLMSCDLWYRYIVIGQKTYILPYPLGGKEDEEAERRKKVDILLWTTSFNHDRTKCV